MYTIGSAGAKAEPPPMYNRISRGGASWVAALHEATDQRGADGTSVILRHVTSR